MLICGVDDAGRGAVIGPLIIAAVLIDKNGIKKLKDLQVKDSKLISPLKRRRLFSKILEVVKNKHVVKISPCSIDKVVKRGKRLHRLNRLEADAMAEAIRFLKPDIAYVDASDVIPERFGKHIKEKIPFDVKIISEHKADLNYPVVSAASIIAKVERDSMIEQIRKENGNIGSGYPSDSKTKRFLKDWVSKHSDYPDFVRKSWKPAKKIMLEFTGCQKQFN